jgi:hypothetical protein
MENTLGLALGTRKQGIKRRPEMERPGRSHRASKQRVSLSDGLSEDRLHRFVSDRGRVFLTDGQVTRSGFQIGVPKHLLNVGN